MRILITALLLIASPALAEAPWLGGDEVDGDAIAEAPLTEADDDEIIDLRSITATLEEGVRQVVVDGADPLDALPIDLAPAPETTAAELRGLLAGSGAQQAKLHGVEVLWVLWNGTTSVQAFRATLLPGQASSLLALSPAPLPETPGKAVLPGGLGRSWANAEKQLTKTLKQKRCAGLPVADDVMLGTVVPPAYLEQAKATRTHGAAQRAAVCDGAAKAEWDRMELRLDTLHFNLFDAAGALRGGLRLGVDQATGTFAYPLFKKLQ